MGGTLADIIASGAAPGRKPWEEAGTPGQRIDPAALAASMRGNLPSAETPMAPSDEAAMLADRMAQRQELVRQGTQPAAEAAQSVVVPAPVWAKIEALLSRMLGSGR